MLDVALIRWPQEESRRSKLAATRHPRLLLVDADAAPPRSRDILEDWVRLPVPDEDVRARVRNLEARISEHLAVVPTLEPDGILRREADSVALSPLQARLVAPLVDRFGSVVARAQLVQAGWPEARPERNAVDAQVARLRRRVASVGLRLVTVRSRGFLLEAE